MTLRNRCTAVFFFAVCFSASLPAFADGPSAVVVYVQGTVHIQKLQGGEQLAALGTEIQENDTIVTEDASQVRVRLFDRSLLRIGPSSKAQMAQLRVDASAEKKEVSIKLTFGRLWASVSKLLTPDSRFEVTAANAVAGVRGTKLDVQSDGKSGQFACLEGKVEVTSGGQHQTLGGGTQVGFNGTFGELVHLSLHDIIQRNEAGRGGAGKVLQLGEKGAEQKAQHLATILGDRFAQGRADRGEGAHIHDLESARDRELASDTHNRGSAFVEFNEATRLGIPLDRTRIEGTVTVH